MKNRPLIVLFTSLYMPHLGGVEKYSQSLAEELSHHSDVHVFCLNTENQPAIQTENGVTVHYLPCKPLANGRLPIPTLRTFAPITSFFAHKSIDFAILQTRLYPFNAWVTTFLAQKKIPYITIEHGSGHLEIGGKWLNRAWRIYEHLITLPHRIACKDFYAVSNAGIAYLKHFGIVGKGVISNATAPKDYANIFAWAWRTENNISTSTRIVTFAGRVIREKGVCELIAAFQILNAENTLLVIAGDGDDAILNHNPMPDRIMFSGQIAHAELLSLLADTDIFCFPTDYFEGLPTVLLEAGYLGVPCITTDRGGICELIQNDQTGIILQSAEAQHICTALHTLLQDPQKMKTLGTNLQTVVRVNFVWPIIAKQVLKIAGIETKQH